MKEKKLLLARPPDRGKTSWFAPFQGILTNTDLLLSNEKVRAIICSGILFTKNLYHIEACQLICIQILRDFTESYFGRDYSYLVTMSFVCSFNKN